MLPSAVVRGDVALPATEAQGFALFALDALARKPVGAGGIVHAEELAERVPELAVSFEHHELAVRLARGLHPDAKTEHVIEWIHALAGPPSG